MRLLSLTRRKLAIVFLAFALATTADTCTDANTGEPIPHEHTPAPAPQPQTDPTSEPTDSDPPEREGSFEEDGTTSKPAPGIYVVETQTTEDGREILVERPPLCSTATENSPCIESYYEDADGNEVWVLPEEEGQNTEDNVNTAYCGSLGVSVDHSGAPVPHIHPAPFPYDHDGEPSTPDICSHSSENCAWHNICPQPRPTANPPVIPPSQAPTSQPTSDPKVCTSSWNDAARNRLLSNLRWESVIPYTKGFTDHHHPEVPGGRLFLTAASSGASSARHWVARQPGTTLDVVDAEENGCLWTATAVGVSFRELLPYEPSDLATLISPGSQAAAAAARKAAALWIRLDQQRKRWFQTAFPRNDPSTTWCSPSDLPPWTTPPSAVLSLSSSWESRYGKCRWNIPRRGFWEWQLQIEYTSELGDHHTEVVAANLSWFREPTDYLGRQVTLW